MSDNENILRNSEEEKKAAPEKEVAEQTTAVNVKPNEDEGTEVMSEAKVRHDTVK